jgi:hypothetical protein
MNYRSKNVDQEDPLIHKGTVTFPQTQSLQYYAPGERKKKTTTMRSSTKRGNTAERGRGERDDEKPAGPKELEERGKRRSKAG